MGYWERGYICYTAARMSGWGLCSSAYLLVHYDSLGSYVFCCKRFLGSQIKLEEAWIVEDPALPHFSLLSFPQSLGKVCALCLCVVVGGWGRGRYPTFLNFFAKILSSFSKFSLSSRACDFPNKRQEYSAYFWFIFPSYSFPKAFYSVHN